MLEVENQVQPGSGPPMHVHHLQEESLTVQEGRMGYRLAGGPDRFAGPGDTVTFAPGQMHRFWNAGDGVLRCSGWASPPDNLEYFLTEVFASMQRGGGRPNPFDAAYLLGRYRTEIAQGDIRHPSASWCSPSCAPWVDSWAAIDATSMHRRQSGAEHQPARSQSANATHRSDRRRAAQPG